MDDERYICSHWNRCTDHRCPHRFPHHHLHACNDTRFCTEINDKTTGRPGVYVVCTRDHETELLEEENPPMIRRTLACGFGWRK